MVVNISDENTPPSSFSLISPPSEPSEQVVTLTPQFIWLTAWEPDPDDTVFYELWIADNSDFDSTELMPYIRDTLYILTAGLEWGKSYWWKVRADDRYAGSTWSDGVLMFQLTTLGDADSSCEVNIDDVLYILDYIFSSGAPPVPEFAGDADCNGAVDIDDVVYLIHYIFSGGNAPCDPVSDGMSDCVR